MKIKIEKTKLMEGLNIVSKAISGKTVIPILDGVYIQAINNGIILKGTDMELSIESFVSCNVEKEGTIVIDAKIFNEVIRKLPNSEVTLEVSDNELLKVSCERSLFNIAFMDSTDYPNTPDINEEVRLSMPQYLLKNMIKEVAFAVAQDATRPALQGVLFQVKYNKINMVALDGYRMAIRNEHTDCNNELEVIIPGKVLSDISKAFDDNNSLVNIKFTKNHIMFEVDNVKICCRLLEEKFVNYLSLIPSESKISIEVKKQDFLQGIERTSIVAREANSNLVKLVISDSEIIASSNSTKGLSKENISINKKGEDITIAFNSKYLEDVLKNITGEQIILEMTSPVSPCLIKNTNNTGIYLVLPVRLNV